MSGERLVAPNVGLSDGRILFGMCASCDGHLWVYSGEYTATECIRLTATIHACCMHSGFMVPVAQNCAHNVLRWALEATTSGTFRPASANDASTRQMSSSATQS